MSLTECYTVRCCIEILAQTLNNYSDCIHHLVCLGWIHCLLTLAQVSVLAVMCFTLHYFNTKFNRFCIVNSKVALAISSIKSLKCCC